MSRLSIALLAALLLLGSACDPTPTIPKPPTITQAPVTTARTKPKPTTTTTTTRPATTTTTTRPPATTTTTSASKPATSPASFGVKVSGSLLTDLAGNVLELRGVNRPGTEYRCMR